VAEQGKQTVADRQFAVFIASHYRATIVDDRSWNDPLSLSMVKSEQRKFAERCVAEHPTPTIEEIADADAAMGPQLRQFTEPLRPYPLGLVFALLIVYVSIPALIAALLFRGGWCCAWRASRSSGGTAGVPRAHLLAGPGGVEPDGTGTAVPATHAPRTVK
jgi:hypothetical protein